MIWAIDLIGRLKFASIDASRSQLGFELLNNTLLESWRSRQDPSSLASLSSDARIGQSIANVIGIPDVEFSSGRQENTVGNWDLQND